MRLAWVRSRQAFSSGRLRVAAVLFGEESKQPFFTPLILFSLANHVG